MDLGWHQYSPATTPLDLTSMGMGYDPDNGYILVFGGQKPVSPGMTQETWTWDGTDWTHLTPATTPPKRFQMRLVHDDVNNEMMFFGGLDSFGGVTFLNDTYTWDGTDWTLHSPTHSPSVRSRYAMCWDANNGYVLLFGGTNGSTRFDETWTWDGTDWTQLSPTNKPSGRSNVSMDYDTSSGNVVLFGGLTTTVQSDTWTWDGTDWTQQSPATTPTALHNHKLVYDPDRAVIVMHGGDVNTGAGSAVDETWEWNGTNWNQITLCDSPGVRSLHGMAFDPVAHKIVRYAGSSTPSNSSGLHDTWSYPYSCPGAAGGAVQVMRWL